MNAGGAIGKPRISARRGSAAPARRAKKKWCGSSSGDLRAAEVIRQAEEQFKKVLAVNPKNAPVLNYYGYMLVTWEYGLTKRKRLVQRALKEDPYNGAYLTVSAGFISNRTS